MKADSSNGIFVKILALEEDSRLGKIKYTLREAGNHASIKEDPNSKNAFFVTPVSKKLKPKDKESIRLDIWIKFSDNVDDLYIPVALNNEERLYDSMGLVILDNAKWKKLKDVYTFRKNKILISDVWLKVIF
ncbi:MAG: hypothetical protein J7604_00425 [Sporocytophaga sp.]|uniref:hypothetical protein n=1 Tax=Sporocytophaga sp. TaxID=2231183 RepID=UPI001B0D3544|nr:hypothetical protein [Sporocytophaga sp.]MBO9698634.1 hypothetical protein [Sporocytophaga sp.]